MHQEDRESRRLWRHVTVALFRDNIEIATQGWILLSRQNDGQMLDLFQIIQNLFSQTLD
jgi:hypothetical protein